MFNVLVRLEGVGLGKEDVGVEGLAGRGSTAKGRSGWRVGWEGSDGVADMLEHRQGSSGTLPQSRESRRKSEGAERKGKSHACSRETWQDFPSFVCLAQRCSARGNQETSRHGGGEGGGGGGGWGQALHRLQKDGREKVFSTD